MRLCLPANVSIYIYIYIYIYTCPPVVEEMKSFEEGMIHIIQSISFKGTQSQFQEGLEEDIASVKKMTAACS